jgi:hypothetical protein
VPRQGWAAGAPLQLIPLMQPLDPAVVGVVAAVMMMVVVVGV